MRTCQIIGKSMMTNSELKKLIRNVPDFPVKGVQFKDISSILENPKPFQYTVDEITTYCFKTGITHIVAPDARGFIWGAPVSYNLGIPFTMARKKGKLPPPVDSYSYTLEYGEATLEIPQSVSLKDGSKVCIIDDVSATGGTANAMVGLLQKAGADEIYYACVMDLKFLQGTKKLLDYCGVESYSVVEYE